MRRPGWILPSLVLLSAVAIPAARAQRPAPRHQQHAAWRRGAVCYEVFVRSFYDSNGDGIGDLRGLTQKLDYINDGRPGGNDLGARCIWLMPIAESPSYHGYDATNYYKVEPDYGTNDDFRRFVAAAHARGIKVLVDMVLNHTSSENPWFQAALHDTASPYRSWYRFSRTKPDEKGPWGQEVWYRSPVRDEYYYAVFWSGMPDLNYETPAVREEAKKIARFWLTDMRVDGFRLDAVPFLVEEGTLKAGAPKTHRFLHEYERYVRSVKRDAFTVGEVYDTLGTILSYYPDQLDDYFTFPAADALITAVRTGSARHVLDPFLRMQDTLPPERWSPFLSNHDQPRTLTSLGGDRRRLPVAATLLMTLPGFPFVYYGEEIGMSGDKPDERIRTPMQWTGAAPRVGFTTGKPWEAAQSDASQANVAAQEADPGSLLHLYRRLIALRGSNGALADGRLIPLQASDTSVVAYLRRGGGRTVLVVANLGGAPADGVTLSSAGRVLPRGRYGARPLVNGAGVRAVGIAANGRIDGYVPWARLEPLSARVVVLEPTQP